MPLEAGICAAWTSGELKSGSGGSVTWKARLINESGSLLAATWSRNSSGMYSGGTVARSLSGC